MFQTWRLKVREAEEAFKSGDLPRACRLLSDGELVQYLPGRKLAAQVAARKAERARAFASRGEMDVAWQELESARHLAGETGELQKAHRELLAESVHQVRASIARGNCEGALAQIKALEKRRLAAASLQTLKQVAQRVQSAGNLAKRGKFSDAEAQIAAAMQLQSDLHELEPLRGDYVQKGEQSRQLTEQLHRAMSEQAWSKVVSLADQLLELASEFPLARDAHKRAWAKVGARPTDSRRLDETQVHARARSNEFQERTTGPRFLLWVDGVGGYLVCLANEISIGQATPGNQVDVAILADISRCQAKIRREGEGYVIEPQHLLRVNNRPVQATTILRDGDEIEMGAGVRLRFRRPHALSASARLDFISRHRTQPFADSILLMAESCVLGPRRQNHVLCEDWAADVVLYRQDNELYCRAAEPIEIDGAWCDGRGRLQGDSHVSGSDFSLSLEELDRCITQPLL